MRKIDSYRMWPVEIFFFFLNLKSTTVCFLFLFDFSPPKQAECFIKNLKKNQQKQTVALFWKIVNDLDTIRGRTKVSLDPYLPLIVCGGQGTKVSSPSRSLPPANEYLPLIVCGGQGTKVSSPLRSLLPANEYIILANELPKV